MARLLVGSIAIIAVVVVVISSYLLVAFSRQSRATAIGTVDDRSRVLAQLLDRITGTTGVAIVDGLATQSALGDALAGSDAATAVPALLRTAGLSTPAGHALAVLDAQGHVLVSTLPQGVPAVDASLPSVRRALAAGGAQRGLEVLGNGAGTGLVSVDAAERVDRNGAPVGIVVDVAPLVGQLRTFGPAVGSTDDRIAFVAASRPDHVLRLAPGGNAASDEATPSPLQNAVEGGADAVSDTWTVADHEVAGGFVRVVDAAGATVGYLGVEAPLSAFPGNSAAEAATLALLALAVLLLTAIAVVVFVDRSVRRPVARLETGVARIAAGDYAHEVAEDRRDELGRLAGAVNVMRDQIRRNVAEIERGRARLDAAVDRLGAVSRALTTTSGGVPALEDAVVRTAAALAGAETAAAVLYHRDGDRLRPSATVGIAGMPLLDAWGAVAALLEGRSVRVTTPPAGWQSGGLVAVPMFRQDTVVGALAVLTAAGVEPPSGDEAALSVLANNAAIALDNTRLLDQERETVRRLRELDAMKSDFLATVQHELRTPLTAIMGMSELLEMCWEGWGDTEKLSAVHDIQAASRSLFEIVETIIDFSLLERETLGLRAGEVPVANSVDDALTAIAGRSPEGDMGADVDLAIAPDLCVFADPDRFGQVVRALLDNAVKFHTDARGHVTVRAAREGECVRIDVVDRGIGIPSDALDRIFERFYQVDNTATRRFGGTGMGLALVRRLVDAHGASVEVESTPGRGSRFTLRWPATAAAAGGELAGAAG